MGNLPLGDFHGPFPMGTSISTHSASEVDERTRRSFVMVLALLAGAFVLASMFPSAVRADDRDLFVESQASPYVMTIIDTSSSMHRPIAGGGALASSDDPSSRLYQAKAALWEVLQSLEGDPVLGFAHFNQESLFAKRKHWLYKLADSQQSIPWFQELPWPTAGSDVVFGYPDVGGSDGDSNIFSHYTCEDPDTSDEATLLGRLNRFPKLGDDGQTVTRFYMMFNGRRFGVRFSAVTPGTLGAELEDNYIDVTIIVTEWDSSCSFPVTGYVKQKTLRFVPYYSEDPEGRPFTRLDGGQLLQLPTGFLARSDADDFFGLNTQDISVTSACSSGDSSRHYWDPNDTPANYDGVATYQTEADPLGRGDEYTRGDLLPWDWVDHPMSSNPALGFEYSTRETILRRLAPNTTVPGEYELDADGNPIPDFRVARYFQDTPIGYELELKPEFADRPPIISGSGTPLEGVMEDLKGWFDVWKVDAETDDPLYSCRERFLILLTDGLESCSSNSAAADAAGQLFGSSSQDRIRTFVIGFGSDLSSGALEDIAERGGTGADDRDNDGQIDCEQFGGEPGCTGPFLASSKEELIAALTSVFQGVEGGPSSFTSGAPAGRSSISQQSTLLATFEPVSDESVWLGRMRKFVNPIPLDDGLPDTSRLCSTDTTVGCFAWDAAESILGNGPLGFDQTSDINGPTFGLGNAVNQRRLFYVMQPGNVNRVNWTTRLLTPATSQESPAIRYDQWNAFGLDFTIGDSTSEMDAENQAIEIVSSTLAPRTRTFSDGSVIEYLLGDFFHSDPQLVWQTARAEYLGLARGDGVECRNGSGDFDFTDSDALMSYRCFFERTRFRRQVALAGSNSGQIHAFDGGSFRFDEADGISLADPDDRYDNGSGQELFSVVPRALMPHVADLSRPSSKHDWGADGPFLIDDVLIDPDHDGTPNVSEREWRTLAIGGMREGARSYIAIDMTYPDWITQGNDENKTLLPNDNGNYMPSCLTSYSPNLCGSIPYPAVLWEFTDTSDEDLNGEPDLGFTWSRPNSGRVRVTVGSDIETRYVSIFGGGLDPEKPNLSGNFIYMVDIETGKTLYKREVIGSVASAPAAVDTDNDTYLDTLYFGTTAGYMYKVDLSLAAAVNTSALPHPRIDDPDEWTPFILFDTANRPIFYAPSVIYVGQSNQYALAFGTGDREDLWDTDPVQEGRFYVVLDSDFEAADMPSSTGLTSASLPSVDAADGFDVLGDVLLGQPSPGSALGYELRLAANERLVAQPITLIGLLVFSTYTPDGTTGNGCDSNGTSNLYTIFAASGNPLSQDQRFRTVEGYVGTPFTQSNTVSSSNDPDAPSDELTDELEAIRDVLRSQLPSNCKFNNATIDVKAIRSDTGIEYLAPVPICVVLKNWRERF